MSQTITDFFNYRGYLGTVEFSEEDNILFGRVLGLKSTYLSYEGNSLDELEKDFHESIDFYLECCEDDGIKPVTTDIALVQSQIDSNSQQLLKRLTKNKNRYLSDDRNSMVYVNRNY